MILQRGEPGGLARRVVAACCLAGVSAFAGNWPQWRGPGGNGTAAAGDYPLVFSPSNGVLWRVPLPGRGSSTPAVWGDRVFLTSGVGEGTNGQDGALCFDWETGRRLWQVTLGPQRVGRHRRGNGSCPSPVTDGRHVFVYFKSGTLAAIDFAGNAVWRVNLQERYGRDTLLWDLGTSPVLADGKLVVAVMQDAGAYVVAFDPQTGDVRWKVPRPFPCAVESGDSYTTPLVTRQDGRTVLVLWGAGHLSGHDAADGRMRWSCGGFNPENKPRWRDIASPALDGDLVIVPYGREQFTAGVRIGGEGDITSSARLWERRGVGTDSSTPAAADGRAYLVNAKGRVWGIDLLTGRECGTLLLPGGKGAFFSSPALAGDRLYLCREGGGVYVVRVAPDKLSLLSETHFDEVFVASPILVRNRLLLRGERSLLCIGAAPRP
ncbi:MAG: PQQ-binding-like beta-propeller repeat protein [Kiritimatiellia bacterium]|nr:PQQ-binding-like beta-propeller repeat protein [Kiritimatiellia bacterium]